MVWGFGIFLKHLRAYITTSRFIPTEAKERLIKSLEMIYRQLVDAEKRANGSVPLTPEKEKEWRDGINRRRLAAGKAPLRKGKS